MASVWSCSGCDTRWTALTWAHCGVGGCHDTFLSVEFFDWHRVDGVCWGEPKKKGAVRGSPVRHKELKKLEGVYGTSQAHQEFSALRNRLIRARSKKEN